jgi:hypothetical protein
MDSKLDILHRIADGDILEGWYSHINTKNLKWLREHDMIKAVAPNFKINYFKWGLTEKGERMLKPYNECVL